MMNKAMIVFIVCIFLIFPIFALSKPVEVQTITGNIGLEIAYPLVEYGMSNTQFYPHFHVFNTSNGYQYREGDNINCTLDIYAPNGDEIFTGWNSTFQNFDIEISIPSNLFDSYGTYSYIVSCEEPDIVLGGAINSALEINPSGKELENNFIPIIIVYMILGGVYFFFGNLNKKNIMNDSGKVTTWLAILSYTMIIIKVISLSYFTYSYYIGADISTLLSFIWFADLFVLLSISIITLILIMLGNFNPTLKDSKWVPKKW